MAGLTAQVAKEEREKVPPQALGPSAWRALYLCLFRPGETMTDPYLAFDGPAQWGDPRVSKGYDLEIYAGSDGWLPHIEIEPTVSDYNLTYHFIRSFDEVGVYTPGYAIPDPAFGVFSLSDDLSVPTWMPAAIERAGFGYDPVSNAERGRSTEPTTHRDQTELVA